MHCRMSMLEVADRENCVDRGNRAHCRMLILDVADRGNCAHCRILILEVADRGNCMHFVQLTLGSVCIARY